MLWFCKTKTHKELNEPTTAYMCETDKSHKYLRLEKTCKTKKTVNSNTFLTVLSMKFRARTFPAVLASSPVKRPIPAPSSSTDFPSYGGSKDRIYRKGIQPCQYVSPDSWKPRKSFYGKSKRRQLNTKITKFFEATRAPSGLISHCSWKQNRKGSTVESKNPINAKL